MYVFNLKCHARVIFVSPKGLQMAIVQTFFALDKDFTIFILTKLDLSKRQIVRHYLKWEKLSVKMSYSFYAVLVAGDLVWNVEKLMLSQNSLNIIEFSSKTPADSGWFGFFWEIWIEKIFGKTQASFYFHFKELWLKLCW